MQVSCLLHIPSGQGPSQGQTPGLNGQAYGAERTAVGIPRAALLPIHPGSERITQSTFKP
jgi:hypothetical protein